MNEKAKMNKAQYGNDSSAVGRTPELDKHPASDPRGTADDKFSNMQVTDHKEHHDKAIKNMSVQAHHQKSMPITDNQAYKRQSHAIKPKGPIQSFVGNRLDTKLASPTKTLKPKGKEAQYDKNNMEEENKS